MAWYQGSWSSVAAGSMLALFDNYVCLNGKWSVHDAAAGTNAKVYKCEDAAKNVLFYVLVSDNQANYAIIELWEGWDAVGHAGVGANIKVFSSTYAFWTRRWPGGWALSVLDHRILYVDLVNGTTTYIGAPRRFDESKNIVLITTLSTGNYYYNNLGYFPNGSNGGGRFLFDEAGNQAMGNIDGGANNSVNRKIKGTDGVLRFVGELAVSGNVSDLAVGTLEGVMDLGAGASLNFSPGFGETVEIDGTDWMLVAGSYSTKYWSAIRKA